MAGAILVKKARKPNPVVTQADIDRANAGEAGAASYWTWSLCYGGRHQKRYAKQRPRPSQTTASEFLSALYAIQESMEDAEPTDADDFVSMRDAWAEEIRELGDQQTEKFDNMPPGLQDGDTGQLLQERADAMEQWAGEVESVEVDTEDDSDTVENLITAAMDEIRGTDAGC